MDFSYTTTLTLLEGLSLMGLAQSLLIFVYVSFRARELHQAAFVLAYFFILSLAFALQFALRLEDFAEEIRLGLWLAWMHLPPLCYLIVVQIAQTKENHPRPQLKVLFLIPFAILLVLLARHVFDFCDGGYICGKTFDWLYWLGSMAGAGALLMLWMKDGIFTALWKAKDGRERYWLAMALIAVNILIVVSALLRSSGELGDTELDTLLVTAGFAFVYLVSTALFRVYPRPVQFRHVPRFSKVQELSAAERVIADQVRKLMEVDKVYQERTLSRASLARELQVAESTLSKVINNAFGKSFPQMINQYRIGDAKILLRDPVIPVQVVATEAGFNSLASFNRVFRDLVGKTPTDYRQKWLA